MEELLEEAKKKRAVKARMVTRRIFELQTAVSRGAAKEEIVEKIEVVKNVFDELGYLQDEVFNTLGEAANDPYDATVIPHIDWYKKYDDNVNDTISSARTYLETLNVLPTPTELNASSVIKIQKLKIPIFESQPRTYLK